MLLTILTVVFLLLYGWLFFYYFLQWKKIAVYDPPPSPATVFVSVIVAARNEQDSLPLLVKDLEAQAYPRNLFEVIIVDDYSTDNTALSAKTFDGQQFQMILPDAPPARSSKKACISSGIKRAKGELIVVTDADCRLGKYWLATIAGFYKANDAAFIAAPVKLNGDRSVISLFQLLDFITLQGITAASVAADFHTMCNGANLAYTRQAFEEVNGFEGIDKIATGDDMLLMHKIRKKNPGKVLYLKSKQAIVSTAPMKTWKGFLMQRKRWASKTLVYDDRRIILVLVFVLVFNLFFWVLLAAAFINKAYWIQLLCLLAGKTMIEWPFVSSVAAFFGQQKLMRYFILMQPFHIFYTVFVGVLSQFGKYEWKGRLTR